MNRNISTISRELKRNTGKRGYRHQQAHQLACTRHKEKIKIIKLTTQVKDYLTKGLKAYCSPEQIVNKLRVDKNMSLSTETTYRLVFKDKAIGGELYTYLRHQHKKYRKHYGKND